MGIWSDFRIMNRAERRREAQKYRRTTDENGRRKLLPTRDVIQRSENQPKRKVKQ